MKKKFKRFIKNNPILLSSNYLMLVGLIIGILLLTGATISLDSKTVSTNAIPSISPSPIPTDILTPTNAPAAYVDPDPITTCTSSYPNCIGQSIKLKLSACSKITCCGFTNGRWVIYSSDEACDRDQGSEVNQQANAYPPCTVYYKYSGYSKTYNNTSPSDCLYWQQKGIASTQPLNLPEIKAAPLPTVAPYQYSQEYIDAMNKANQVLNSQWQPTQFVAPTSKCYATWTDYFNAHPNYASQNITQMSGNPPCD